MISYHEFTYIWLKKLKNETKKYILLCLASRECGAELVHRTVNADCYTEPRSLTEKKWKNDWTLYGHCRVKNVLDMYSIYSTLYQKYSDFPHKKPTCHVLGQTYSYSVASVPAVTRSAFFPGFRLFLGQCIWMVHGKTDWHNFNLLQIQKWSVNVTLSTDNNYFIKSRVTSMCISYADFNVFFWQHFFKLL